MCFCTSLPSLLLLQMDLNKISKWIITICAISILAFVYKTYNPGGNSYFPNCPFKEFTGLECPGCGSQRATHYLLNLDIINALRENALLVISTPYLLLGLVFEYFKNNNSLKWRKSLFGQKAIFVILFIIIAFWLLRNIT